MLGALSEDETFLNKLLGLLEVAADRRLAGSEQGNVPTVLQLAEVAGLLVVASDLCIDGRNVAQLEQVADPRRPGTHSEISVVALLRQSDNLGGDIEPFFGVGESPDRHVAVVQDGSQGPRVGDPP